MIICDLTLSFAQTGHILTGRSALGLLNVGTSIDPHVIMISTPAVTEDKFLVNQYWLIPRDEDFEIIDYEGYQIASLNQAILDSLIYDYDDSHLFELAEVLTEEEIQDFIIWVTKRGKFDLIKEKLEYYEFI